MLLRVSALMLLGLIMPTVLAQPALSGFEWPEGKKMALSLSFDDARASQVDNGIPLLDKYDVKATFYLVPQYMRLRLEKWQAALRNGHEMGNHTLHHPCTGNFNWVWQQGNISENYTLKKIKREIVETNRIIEAELGVKPQTFAYTCGDAYVGRGKKTKSYVPIVAKLFKVSRDWAQETSNNPMFTDMARITAISMDNKSFEQVLPDITEAYENNKWLVLAGHKMGGPGRYSTDLKMLEELIQHAQKPDSGIWLAPIVEVADYVLEQRRRAK